MYLYVLFMYLDVPFMYLAVFFGPERKRNPEYLIGLEDLILFHRDREIHINTYILSCFIPSGKNPNIHVPAFMYLYVPFVFLHVFVCIIHVPERDMNGTDKYINIIDVFTCPMHVPERNMNKHPNTSIIIHVFT